MGLKFLVRCNEVYQEDPKISTMTYLELTALLLGWFHANRKKYWGKSARSAGPAAPRPVDALPFFDVILHRNPRES
jgi:hypothetical protein